MSYYTSEEINALRQENIELKQKLEDIRTTICDIFDKNTKDGDEDLYLDALIRIENVLRNTMLLNLSTYDEKLLNGTKELAKQLHGQEIVLINNAGKPVTIRLETMFGNFGFKTTYDPNKKTINFHMYSMRAGNSDGVVYLFNGSTSITITISRDDLELFMKKPNLSLFKVSQDLPTNYASGIWLVQKTVGEFTLQEI